MIRVRIDYVDGTFAEGPLEMWTIMPSEGVDTITIYTRTGSTRIAGMTIYWLYRQGDVWHRGGAGLGAGYIGGRSIPMPPEVLIFPDEHMEQVPLEWVPDMPHSAVKLGWWYPGTEGIIQGGE